MEATWLHDEMPARPGEAALKCMVPRHAIKVQEVYSALIMINCFFIINCHCIHVVYVYAQYIAFSLEGFKQIITGLGHQFTLVYKNNSYLVEVGLSTI